jgi:hypothetical protein
MKRTALLAALLLLAGCTSATRSPLARFPWIDAIRHAPPVLVWKCEPGVRLSDGSVYCHPDPDAPPAMDRRAHLLSPPESLAGFAKMDTNPNAPCAKYCRGPETMPPGCWDYCRRLAGCPLITQEERTRSPHPWWWRPGDDAAGVPPR